MKSVAILLVALMLCPAFAFAVEEKPVVMDETVAVAEDAGGNVVGEAVETDELYAPATAKDIKDEAKEEIKEVKEEAKAEVMEVKEEAKQEVKDIKAEEKEAVQESAM